MPSWFRRTGDRYRRPCDIAGLNRRHRKNGGTQTLEHPAKRDLPSPSSTREEGVSAPPFSSEVWRQPPEATRTVAAGDDGEPTISAGRRLFEDEQAIGTDSRMNHHDASRALPVVGIILPYLAMASDVTGRFGNDV